MSFFMDINSHYSQIQLALFSKALPYSTGSSFIFLFKRRGSHFSFFFSPFVSAFIFCIGDQGIIRSGNGARATDKSIMPHVLILQHTEWCHWGLMNATSAWTTHRQCWNSLCSYLVVTSITLIDTISSLPPSAASSALGRKGTCSWNSSLTKKWGFLAFSCKFCEAGFKRRNSWHLRSKFCPNSTVFAEIIFIWHFCPSLRVPKSLSGSTYHRRWLMLALSEEWMHAHPIWANQERRTTCMKPPDTLLDKSSHKKKSHSDEGWEEKSKM